MAEIVEDSRGDGGGAWQALVHGGAGYERHALTKAAGITAAQEFVMSDGKKIGTAISNFSPDSASTANNLISKLANTIAASFEWQPLHRYSEDNCVANPVIPRILEKIGTTLGYGEISSYPNGEYPLKNLPDAMAREMGHEQYELNGGKDGAPVR